MISGNVRPAIGRMIQRLSNKTSGAEMTAVAVAMEPPAEEAPALALCAPVLEPTPEPAAVQVDEQIDASEERAQFEAVMTRMMEENENLRERLRLSEHREHQLAERSMEAGQLGEVIGDIAERMSIALLNLSIQVSRAQGVQTGETDRRLFSATEELALLCEQSNRSAARLARLTVAQGTGAC